MTEIVVPDYSSSDERVRLENRHRYHPPQNDQLPRYDEIRRDMLRLSLTIDRCCPPSQEKLEAQRLLTMVRMWANSSIAIHEAADREAPST